MTSRSPAWRNGHARGGPGGSPPAVVVQGKALACEWPARQGAPLARWSNADLAAATRASGLVATISASTVWRWLHADAIRPWQHRCWLFPRAPDFAASPPRAGRDSRGPALAHGQKSQAAARLGLSRFQLYTRLKRYQVEVSPD
jgi:hypothetical protein